MNEIYNIKVHRFVRLTFVFILFVISLSLFIGKSFGILLDNDVEVAENSELIYYLNVSYDGVDKNGTESSTTTVSEINSGYLYVEDKIPDGLEFTGFVTTEDGSIGAVKRSDGSSCLGKVIDDTNEDSTSSGKWNETHTEYTYHGLHYNDSTRIVTFQVKNLKAGCDLTVGIKTKTPTVDDPDTPEKEIRRDFYNFASAKEGSLTVFSNIVHAFMGKEDVTLYNVKYEYTGEVPSNAPSAPTQSSYSEGSTVGVANNIDLEGYTFSGWTTSDATITNGSFTMPSGDVVLKGSFSSMNKNKVTYDIDGIMPSGYVVPSEKSYYKDSVVSLDSLKEGDVFNGYRFLGWRTEDVVISSEREFTMPDYDIVLVGEFEEVTYKVIYKFYDTVLPPNYEDYLPDEEEYRPGDTVIVEDLIDGVSGYKFLGWYKESEFEMPEHDVVIYGEWKVQNGEFEPEITKEVVSEKEYYRVGDTVRFKITVTNTESYPIKDVIVKELGDSSLFESGTGYSVLSDHFAKIDRINAYGSVDLYATYIVTSTDTGTITNTVELKGALSDNDYELKDKDYTASASFKIQSKLKICKKVSGNYNENVFQFKVVGTTNNYETWVVLGNNECETIYVDPSTYKIKEIVPQEYRIKSVSGAISADDSSFVILESNNYEVTYTNEFVKKGFMHSFGRVINKIVQEGS